MPSFTSGFSFLIPRGSQAGSGLPSCRQDTNTFEENGSQHRQPNGPSYRPSFKNNNNKTVLNLNNSSKRYWDEGWG